MERDEIQLLQTSVQRVINEGRETGELARALFRQGLPRTGKELERYCEAVPELSDRQALMAGLYGLQCTQQEDERYNMSGLYEQLVGVLDRITAVTVIAEELLELFREHPERYTPMSGLYGGLAVLQEALDSRVDRLQAAYSAMDSLWQQLPEEAPACSSASTREDRESIWEMDDYGYIFQVFGECLTAYLNCNLVEDGQAFAERVQQYLLDFARGKATQSCCFTFALWSVDDMHCIGFEGRPESLRIYEGGERYPTADRCESFTNWSYTLHSNGCTEGDLWLSGDVLMDLIAKGAELRYEA